MSRTYAEKNNLKEILMFYVFLQRLFICWFGHCFRNHYQIHFYSSSTRQHFSCFSQIFVIFHWNFQNSLNFMQLNKYVHLRSNSALISDISSHVIFKNRMSQKTIRKTRMIPKEQNTNNDVSKFSNYAFTRCLQFAVTSCWCHVFYRFSIADFQNFIIFDQKTDNFEFYYNMSPLSPDTKITANSSADLYFDQFEWFHLRVRKILSFKPLSEKKKRVNRNISRCPFFQRRIWCEFNFEMKF